MKKEKPDEKQDQKLNQLSQNQQGQKHDQGQKHKLGHHQERSSQHRKGDHAAITCLSHGHNTQVITRQSQREAD